MMVIKIDKLIIVSLILVTIFSYHNLKIEAARVDELKDEIKTYDSEIEKIEQEITDYRKVLDNVKKETNTLEGEIKRIDVTRQKLSADINLTQKRIDTTNLTLEKVGIEIRENEKLANKHQTSIAEAIRQINNIDQKTFIEIILANNSFSQFLEETISLGELQAKLNEQLVWLKADLTNLNIKKQEKETEENQLKTFQSRLAGQKVVADENKRGQTALLISTKNKESNYQSLLAERLKKKEQLEEEIRKIEEKIRIAIDPNSLPRTGSGVLKWPLAEVRITQYFGNTAFASQNSQIYNGKGHNGIDLAASVGTPVLAALAGQIIGIDDTDRVCSGASYGKWVLIRHDNGLSTLYAHLSYVSVGEGQRVGTNEEIAYTGNSGYTTGPHLHFEVLATEGIKITDGINELKSKSCAGAVYRIPLSGFNGKLNPLSYLPR